MARGDILELLRHAAEIAQGPENYELRQQLLHLDADIRALLDENAALRGQALVSHDGGLWCRRADGGFDGPYCMTCWAGTGELRWLAAASSGLDAVQCPTCRRPAKLPRPPA